MIIYLAGGPGVPSTFAAFTEVGPYLIKSNGDSSFTNVTIQKNLHSLTQNYHLLVIDQPVGTGFSIRQENDTVASASQAADYLITFFLRFYELYPSLNKIPTYFYGHSYAAKYVSNLVYKWLQHSELSKVNIAGVILGNPSLHPIIQFKLAETAYASGIINKRQKEYLLKKEDEMKSLYESGDLSRAADIYYEMVAYLQSMNVTGGAWNFNYVLYVPKDSKVPVEYTDFLCGQVHLSKDSSNIREILQIPEGVKYTFLSPDVRGPFLKSGDFMNPATNALEFILEKGIDTLIYAGQFDGAIVYSGLMDSVSELKWTGIENFNAAEKSAWYDSKEESVAGSYQEFENLHFAVVNNSGHFSVYDQGQNMLVLFDKFINRKTLKKEGNNL